MKKIFTAIFVFLFLTSQICFSQSKELTIDQAVVGLWRELRPQMIWGLDVRPASKQLSKTEANKLIVMDFMLKKETELINIEEINTILEKANKEKCNYFYQYQWLDANTIRFNQANNIIDINVKTKALVNYIPREDNFENIDLCEQSLYSAYTIDNNLYIVDKDGNSKQISNETNKGIVFGQTVHRNEFGIEKGTYWSPKGNFLAFYRKDETMVTDYPIVDTDARIAELNNIKYCMAGMKSEEVSLGIYDLNTSKTIYIETGEPKEQFLTSVSWNPDEKSIYIGVLNREQNHLKLNQYDIKTGKFIKTLFEEKSDKYVEPQHSLIFLPKQEDKFIWQTRKDGFSHLYLYDSDGKQINQITKGEYEVSEFYRFSKDANHVFIKANKETPIDFDIYKVNVFDSKITRISKDNGSHSAIISKDGDYIIDNYSNTSTANAYSLFDSKGKQINTTLKVENPLADFNLAEIKIGTLKADDGKTDLYYRLILPPNLDLTKKYPAIIYVYGGPHAQLVQNKWMGGASGWEFYMAQEGYVMLTIDNRGSANRGLEFENIIHRQLGTVEVRDQLSGVEFLKSLSYVDISRIGVHGWSYGGFMTTTLMTDHADIFKVGVAGGPVINWELYEIMYGERYMDMPQENEEGYANNNLLNKANKLKGRLMLIHGTSDPVVVWQHSLNFVQKCIEEKILLDYFVYPEHEHNVGGMDRIHLMRIVSRYFKDFL